MRNSVRAVVIRDEKLLVMQRNKFGSIYYTLIGGGIEPGETLQQALTREVLEETGLKVIPGSEKHVFTHDIDSLGRQFIFVCSVEPGEPILSADSEEAFVHANGVNLFTPMWLPIGKLLTVPFRSTELAKVLDKAIKQGFPERPEQV